MFFSYQILIRKNSSFAVIWRYMHDRTHAKLSKKELMEVDIGQACADLRSYVPTGKLDASEITNKMSLYLLAQLSYGITLVLNKQADYLIIDLNECLRSMIRVPMTGEEEKKKPRKRRKTAGVELVTAPISMEQLLEDEERETGEGRKKRRTTRTTKGPSLLDLSDARSYIDHQVPGQRAAPIMSPEEEKRRQMEDNFIEEESLQLPPPEWPALQEPPAPKVSMAPVRPDEDEEESFLRECLMTITATTPATEQQEISAAELSAAGSMESFDQGPAELPIEQFRVPGYRRGLEEEEEAQRSFEEILMELPDLEEQPPKRHRRRGKLVIDKKTQISTEEMKQQMCDVTPLCRTLDDLHREIEQRQQPTLAELFAPRPFHLKGLLSEELISIFDIAAKKFQERPLSFEEAQRLSDEELQARRYDVEMASVHWPDQTPPTSLEQTLQLTQQEEMMLQPPLEEEFQKVSMFQESMLAPTEEEEEGGVPLRPSTPLEREQQRRGRDTSMLSRITEPSLGGPLLEESFVHPMADISLVEQARDLEAWGVHDLELQRESILVKPSPDQEEEGWIDEGTEQLFNNIVTKQRERVPPSVFFHQAADVGNRDRKQVARAFFSLLKLLKNGKVKAMQPKAFGKILIRARGSPNELDVSFVQPSEAEVDGEEEAEQPVEEEDEKVADSEEGAVEA